MTARLLPAAWIALALAAPAAAGDELERVTAHFESTFSDYCDWEGTGHIAELAPQSWPLTWRYDWMETEYSTNLYQFFCRSGAYNVQSVYYLVDAYEGPLPVAFAVPFYDVEYEDGDFDGDVLGITLTGFTTQHSLTNAGFDPETETIVSAAHWRGLGDASSSGRWAFVEGRFVLKSYDVDASYDGEINPERIVDFP